MEDQEKSMKIGWVGGWCGGVLWIALLSFSHLLYGRYAQSIIGFGIFALSIAFITNLVPWKFPHTKYWRLLAPTYCLCGVALIWAFNSSGGLAASGMNVWQLFVLLPCLTPMLVVGNRTWHLALAENNEIENGFEEAHD